MNEYKLQRYNPTIESCSMYFSYYCVAQQTNNLHYLGPHCDQARVPDSCVTFVDRLITVMKDIIIEYLENNKIIRCLIEK